MKTSMNYKENCTKANRTVQETGNRQQPPSMCGCTHAPRNGGKRAGAVTAEDQWSQHLSSPLSVAFNLPFNPPQ